MSALDDESTGWADRPANRQRIRNILYGACALLVVVDFLVERHVELPLEELPSFYALYGFAALVTVVLLAKGLRVLVGRGEDYYHRGEGEKLSPGAAGPNPHRMDAGTGSGHGDSGHEPAQGDTGKGSDKGDGGHVA